MNLVAIPALLLLLAGSTSTETAPSPSVEAPLCRGDRWPALRGNGTSTTSASSLPHEWGSELNLSWSIDLRGYGQSSPVVWNDQVYVTAVDGANKEILLVTSYRATDGTLLWSRSFEAGQKIQSTAMVSRAAPTPAIDDSRLYVFFESGNLIALDHEGTPLWERVLTREYGDYAGNHGIGASVALTERGVVLLLDHEGPSYLVHIDKETGKNLWKVDREPKVSWSTPVVTGPLGEEEVVVSSNGAVECFNALDGTLRWEMREVKGNTIPTPTILGDRVIVGCSSDPAESLAITRPRNDDHESTLIWRTRAASGFGSPLVYGGSVFIVNKTGVLSCLDVATGELRWKHRLAESCWASPIGAEGLVYFFGKEGTTQVVRAQSDEAEVVAENLLPTDTTVYGVAATDGTFFVREGTKLRCIRAPSPDRTLDDEEPAEGQ